MDDEDSVQVWTTRAKDPKEDLTLIEVSEGDILLVEFLSLAPWVSGRFKIVRNTDGVPELRSWSDLREGLYPSSVYQSGNSCRSVQWLVLFPRCLGQVPSSSGNYDYLEGIVVRDLDGEVFWTGKHRDWTRTKVVRKTEWV